MNKRYKAVLSALNDWSYPLLLLAAGIVLIAESCRLTGKYHPVVWITGPSGFMMIVGIILLCLVLLESCKILWGKYSARQSGGEKIAVTQAASDISEASQKTDTTEADISADVVQNYQGAEEEHSPEEKKQYKKKMLISLGLLAIYSLLIGPLGFTLASTLYVGVNLAVLKNSWKAVLITSAVIFVCLMWGAPAMGLSLPRGLLGF